MPSKEKIEPLNIEQLAIVAQWRSDNADNAPAAVLTVIDQHKKLLEALAGSKYKQGCYLTEMKRAYGIIPSSEKTSPSGHPIGATSNRNDKKPRDLKERLLQEIGRHTDLATMFRKWANKHGRLAKSKGGELEKYDSVDDVPITPEEEAEIEQENAAYMERLTLGGGQNPAFEKATEPFMRGSAVTVTEESAEAPVTADQLAGRHVEKRLFKKRTRYDFAMTVKRVTINVEKAVVRGDDGETSMICGSVAEFGPPDSNLTWGLLANLMILVSQFALPFNRLEKLLSVPGKVFSSEMLSDWYAYIATRFVPIYLELARQLANAEALGGDDTKHRVVELIRFEKVLKAALALAEKEGKEIAVKYPWEHYATIDAATATLKKEGPHDLGTLIGAVLPFVSDRLDGKGVKGEFYTSVVHGRAVQTDPRSLIILFRSHHGSFGNLLNALMQLRNLENTKLLVQSDLAIINLITDEKVLEWLDVTYFGCASHARRVFKQYAHEDPEACAHMLHLFKMVFFYEKGIDLFGRNAKNTAAVRNADSRPVWEQIREVAKTVATRWSASTKLGERARYIDRHFKKLTAYLDEPRISSPGNDFSERMLRPEKLIQGSSLFRFSLNGRFALDVNRSMLQSAIAARVPLKRYVEFVLKTPDAEIKANPAKFTPHAFAKTLTSTEGAEQTETS